MRVLRASGGGGGERGGGVWGGEAAKAARVPARRPGVPVHGPRAPSCCRRRSYLCEVRVTASVRAGVTTQGGPEQPGRCSPRTVPARGCTARPDHRRRARRRPAGALPFPSSRGKYVLRAAFQEAAGCAAPLSVATRSALPASFFSQFLPSGGTEPGEGRELKGHFSSGSPAPVAASGRAVAGVEVAEAPSEALGLGPASAASELILGSYTTRARGRMHWCGRLFLQGRGG